MSSRRAQSTDSGVFQCASIDLATPALRSHKLGTLIGVASCTGVLFPAWHLIKRTYSRSKVPCNLQFATPATHWCCDPLPTDALALFMDELDALIGVAFATSCHTLVLRPLTHRDALALFMDELDALIGVAHTKLSSRFGDTYSSIKFARAKCKNVIRRAAYVIKTIKDTNRLQGAEWSRQLNSSRSEAKSNTSECRGVWQHAAH
ncbi:hypothetical protein BU15DRAFT_68934 [Melanogaster broomeanus]|nr:hypothetical protein BU15DRAFT_68934 [Melanogaster broomeanus]